MAFHPFRRLGLKVVSVVLAALIWLVVSGEQIVERGFRIPLEFSNLPSGLELATDAPTVVAYGRLMAAHLVGRIQPPPISPLSGQETPQLTAPTVTEVHA